MLPETIVVLHDKQWCRNS